MLGSVPLFGSRFPLFGGRRKLPAQRRPPLDRDERIVAWTDTESGPVVATNRGLWLPPGIGSPEEIGRLGWEEIHKAAWNGRELEVTPATPLTTINGYVVMVDEPGFSTPRTDMHICSASSITATPRGFKISSMAVAIWEVMCSWVCSRRA